MILSEWKCPKCKQKLFISNGGDYWCSECQEWKSVQAVDPCDRDIIRFSIVTNYKIEQMLYQGEEWQSTPR